MSERQKIVITLSVLVVVVLVIAGIATKNPGERIPSVEQAESEGGEAAADLGAVFTPEVPKQSELTKPKESALADEKTGASLGVFEMQIDKNGFRPKEIVVKKGDIVQIRLSALDGEYDFSIPAAGIYATMKRGNTETVSFGATAVGTLMFACRDNCPRSGGEGSIIIKP